MSAMTDDDPRWFITNATQETWRAAPGWGTFTKFEPEGVRFPDYGMNIHRLEPGDRSTMYHGEDSQEDFLVLAGEPTVIIEGEERRLRPWDFVHCPAWTKHGFVNTTQEPCAILMVGARREGVETDCVYPVEPLALRHGAGVQTETTSPDEAYAGTPESQDEPYREGTLPGA
jgi:uncharacterized cupin superfamily protein